MNGWKTILGNTVYVERGNVIRGTVLDHNGYQVPASVYRKQGDNTWLRSDELSEAAFRSGIKRGTIKLA